MNQTEIIRRRAREIRQRLRYPPNAVRDSGIDITRKSSGIKGNDPMDRPIIEAPTPPKIRVSVLEKPALIPINLHEILQVVSERVGVSIHDIKGQCRKREISTARKMAVYLAAKLIKSRSLASIGREMDKDHTSILHCRDSIKAELIINPAMVELLDSMEGAILAHHNP